jgi:hypothetical protein
MNQQKLQNIDTAIVMMDLQAPVVHGIVPIRVKMVAYVLQK